MSERQYIEPAPLEPTKLDHHSTTRMRRQLLIARSIAPELWFSQSIQGWRIRQPRIVRALHRLLLEHNGIASRLIVYSQLPKFMAPRRHDATAYWKPGLAGSKDERYRRQLREGISEAKRCGLIEVFVLPEGALRNLPPGRACRQCGLWLSPGDIEAQRTQPACDGPVTAAELAAQRS